MRQYTLPFNAKPLSASVSVWTKHYTGGITFLPFWSVWRQTPAAGFERARNTCLLVMGDVPPGHLSSVQAFIDVLTSEIHDNVIPGNDAGFTFDPRALQHVPLLSGQYVVSLRGAERKFIDRPARADVRAWVSEHSRELRKPGVFVGGWRDDFEGLFYLDLSTVFNDRETALRAARENGQKAVYSASDGVLMLA